LHLEGQGIWARGEGLDDGTVGQGLSVVAWGNDFEEDFTGSGFLDDGVLNRESESVSDLSDWGRSIGRVDDDFTNTMGASSDLLADEYGIGVDDVKELDEFINANNVAKKIAKGTFNRVREERAESTAASKDTTVGDDFDQLLESLIHEINARLA